MQIAFVYASLLVHLYPFFPRACARVAIEIAQPLHIISVTTCIVKKLD